MAMYILGKIEILLMRARTYKGLSPLIAAVFLIAATMTVAAVLAYWASDLIRPSFSGTNQTQAMCQSSDFTIYQCAYDKSTGEIDMLLYNTKSNSVGNLQAFVFDAEGNSGSAIPVNGTIAPALFLHFSIPNVAENFTKVVVSSGTCPNLLKESECTRSS